ncbi:gamma-glutamyltransferase family protein [Streptomyces malaysiensis]|uniref:Gamma-glutamyltransferase family protein n=1 Tax=Streptomyces malaysiensis subsp. samsunensis TaxID=459658 RepID=A0A9X2M537_STRMQ|nr:gamma-glutamyltransferase family protein [Streptomyces samsunensis]MCQ8835193.1 gamma-glutamyltransferase family protein [Streptomyces samsunensis]WPB90137.1 gamma-glutamyltransferase family protein [Streptomyces malaysiensis]
MPLDRDAFLARPDLEGSFGMAASTHWVASSVAQAVLERGGNAFDAAAAAGLVLHVVEPHLNGPGGELVALLARAGETPQVLSGQGPAPRAATIDHFRSAGLTSVPGSGALAAAVPGAFDAWLLMLRDWGTWELADVLEFAVHYATHGHPLLASAARVIGEVEGLFRDSWPTSMQLWLPEDRAPVAGEVHRNPAWARTLSRLRDEAIHAAGGTTREAVIEAARAIWRGGFVAEAIDRFVSSSYHLHAHGSVLRGVLSATDLAAYAAHVEAPVSREFRGHRIFKAAAWTQGPVLLQALAILEEFSDADLDLSSATGIHLVVETLKLALADRDAHYGAGISDAGLATLLSDRYAKERREQITDVASLEFRPGRAKSLSSFLPPLLLARPDAVGALGEPTVRWDGETRGDTCHVDVIDQWGNAISVTPSGGWLQSSPTIPELGFALGTRLQMTHLDPASPSALRPGLRPRTTLSPTIVTRPDRLIALGTPGGDQQDQWQLVALLRMLVAGLSPQTSIESPMFHTTSAASSFWPRTWTPGGLVAEDRFSPDLVSELRDRGHLVELAPPWSLGRLSLVQRDTARGLLSAAANPRGAQGYATGR